MYFLIVGLIQLWANSGRNAQHLASSEPGIELRSRSGAKWYAPVPNTPMTAVDEERHIIGDDD
jgi:hypothetical protein